MHSTTVYESSEPTSYPESGLSDFYFACDPSSSTVSTVSTVSTIRDLLQYETYVYNNKNYLVSVFLLSGSVLVCFA